MEPNLGANDLKILISDSPEEAPKYRAPEHLYANLTTARVVGKGTIQGKPTVDFIFEDESGQKYVAMLTGRLVSELAGTVAAVYERTK